MFISQQVNARQGFLVLLCCLLSSNIDCAVLADHELTTKMIRVRGSLTEDLTMAAGPSGAPTAKKTIAPTFVKNSTITNTTAAPSMAHASHRPTVSLSPTTSPSKFKQMTPAPSLLHSSPPSVPSAPAHSPSHHPLPSPSMPSAPTHSPTHHSLSSPSPTHGYPHVPSLSPTAANTKSENIPPSFSFWRIVGKTIAWCILLALSVVAFGAIMTHHHRIYRFLRRGWYRFVQWNGTQYVLAQLSRVGSWRPWSRRPDSSLNTIIFENDMSEGLLMSENSS